MSGNKTIILIIGAVIGATLGSIGAACYAKNNKGLSKDDGWDYWKHAVYGGVGGGVAGGVAGLAISGTNAAASLSWRFCKATTKIGTTAYAIGRAFEEWYQKAHNVIEVQVKTIDSRFDTIVNNCIIELKNYNWDLYTSYTHIISSFTNQAEKYCGYIGTKVEGKFGVYLIEGVQFVFSSKPPQAVIDALKVFDVTLKWLK